MTIIKDKRTATNSFRLWYRNTTDCSINEEYYYYSELQNATDKDIIDFFKLMVKKFNNTYNNKVDSNRLFVKVEREYIIRYKNKVVNKYIKL